MTIIVAGITIAIPASVAIAVLGALVRALVRQHARERQQMIDQIMHLSGRTWTPPPAQEPMPVEAPRLTVRNPEQLPDWDEALT